MAEVAIAAAVVVVAAIVVDLILHQLWKSRTGIAARRADLMIPLALATSVHHIFTSAGRCCGHCGHHTTDEVVEVVVPGLAAAVLLRILLEDERDAGLLPPLDVGGQGGLAQRGVVTAPLERRVAGQVAQA